MRTDCGDCPTTDLCRHPDEPCAKRYDAQRARERAQEARRIAFDAKVRTHGYVDRVTGERIYDPDKLAPNDGVTPHPVDTFSGQTPMEEGKKHD